MRRLVLLFLGLLLLLCSACSPALELNTTEEIKAVYTSNEDLFNRAVEALVKYEKEEHIGLTRDKEKVNEEVFVVKEFSGIYIEASDSLADTDFQTIYEECAPLFSALEGRGLLSGFGKYGSHVEFMLEGPKYGDAAELFFVPEGANRPFVSSQKSDSLQITPNWYAEICHY